MFDLDLTGLKINRLRFAHSKKFRGLGFINARDTHDKNGDLTSERNVIVEYLTEECEMDYTYSHVYKGLSVFLMVLVVLLTLAKVLIWVSLGTLVLSFVFRLLSKKKNNEFVMGEAGIDIVKDYYNSELRTKFNL